MELVNNNSSNNHYKQIVSNLDLSDKIIISAAFIKNSGLKLIQASLVAALKRKTEIKIISGLDFALTEPDALLTIFNLFKNTTNKLYLASPETRNVIFHPKIYFFQKKDITTIIIGSANLTSGGLTNNFECSLKVDLKTTEPVFKEFTNFFDQILSSEFCEEATLLAINKYDSFYRQQKEASKHIKAKPERTAISMQFNYATLKKFYSEYQKENDTEKLYKIRMKNYKEAAKVLDEIADHPKLTKKVFQPLFDQLAGAPKSQLWHSGSIFRHKASVHECPKEFQALVKFVKTEKNNKPIFVFEKGKELLKNIDGSAENTLGEIMMSYNPVEFANINRNPIVTLLEADVPIKKQASSFNGEDYKNYCNLVKEISNKLGLRNMIEADSFFNDVYWKIKNKYK